MKHFGISALGLLLLSSSVAADSMQSSNYKIQLDSANAGGLRSSSGSYVVEDTVGEQAVGRSESTTYKIKAGYQQMQEVGLSLSGAANVTLTPSLSVTGGGTSTGSLALTAATDNAAGYRLSVVAANAPAMQSSSATIANYVPSGAAPDFAFTVSSTTAAFGFSPEGSHVTSEYLDDGVGTCSTGASDTSLSCWNPLTTTDETIAESSVANNPSGTVTTLQFRVLVGSSVTLTAGNYFATVTATLIAL